ncbi:nitrate transporter [Methylopila jiangsuensis]|uniref:Nitrate transporter n=1 Tax=Methylopila jiangsuensis TaxID=586230 RepID=A0A9W6JH52_9HYPH|nr:CmpA/NrtA family ABC transporter substrate-binding protein [Methylopila jiangsuensis]MDR6285907.1 NitT/TauT family transport system ATP-binding protein [Methylopila jiangsuensis]GLK75664.1 nitrate transporter [Methylopila jiangsuensis]
MSLDRVRIGFIPLVDAAIPIVAADVGFAAAEGFAIDLAREVSWSNIRDRLTLGHFDVAHLLAPLAIATSLGLGALQAPLAAPVTCGLNGNAITLSPDLYDELMDHFAPDANLFDPRATGAAFAALVRARRVRGDEQPTLGMTFPFSSHNYLLRLWLADAGLTPDEDVRLAVVPPPYMVDALEHGHVDGFCVGAPWNAVAVSLGLGRIIHLGVDLVARCPEKVLAVRESWLTEAPERADALVRACLNAAQWCDDPANRDDLATLLSSPHRLDVPPGVIRAALDGRLQVGRGVRAHDDYQIFGRDHALRPDPRHALWLYAQMTRWRQASGEEGEAARAASVYRPDLFDRAAGTPPPSLLEDPLGVFPGV